MLDHSRFENYIAEMIQTLGDDPKRPGMRDTPKRARQAMEFLTQGYHQNLDEIINGALFESTMDEMVIVKDIEVYSVCEHHLLPFIGKCHVAYLPNGKVLGLSKLARIVEFYARRFQIQEQLTQDIANCIAKITDARGVAVVIEAQHLCMMMRGVQTQSSSMTTSMMLGEFRKSDKTRAEFLSLIK